MNKPSKSGIYYSNIYSWIIYLKRHLSPVQPLLVKVTQLRWRYDVHRSNSRYNEKSVTNTVIKHQKHTIPCHLYQIFAQSCFKRKRKEHPLLSMLFAATFAFSKYRWINSYSFKIQTQMRWVDRGLHKLQQEIKSVFPVFLEDIFSKSRGFLQDMEAYFL